MPVVATETPEGAFQWLTRGTQVRVSLAAKDRGNPKQVVKANPAGKASRATQAGAKTRRAKMILVAKVNPAVKARRGAKVSPTAVNPTAKAAKASPARTVLAPVKGARAGVSQGARNVPRAVAR
jgi:hypothetical protein